jgi:CRP/FNR family transcriptional regulator
MKNWRQYNRALHLVDGKADCGKCDLSNRCLSANLSSAELNRFQQIIRIHGPFKPGEPVFKMEDSFRSLYSIQTGAVKVESVGQDGANLVSGFYFSGELIGIEAIGDHKYRNDAIALEKTWVCELPFDELESLCSSIPLLQKRIMVLLGQKIRHTNNVVVHGHHLSAEKRVLLFLKNLCESRGIQPVENSTIIPLPMTKGDIASYLGLRPESLSRALSRLQNEGLIRNHAKEIELLNVETGYQLACER